MAGFFAGRRRDRAIDVGIALVAFALTLALFKGGGVEAAGEEDVRGVDALGVALAALASLPLVARRRWPLGVYVVIVLANAAMTVLDYPDGPPFGAAIALFFLAAAPPERKPPLRVTLAVVVGLFVGHFVVHGLAQDAFPGVELLLGSTLWAASWFAGERSRVRRERIAELEERALRAEREAERERRLATAEERTRIARDLHDSAGHAINVILVQAGAARLLQERDPERSRAALETIEEVARDTLGEIDQLVRVLRDEDGGDEVEPPPGLAALDRLVAHHAAAGLAVEVHRRGNRRPLPPAVDQAAYRILQEALTNAARHGDSRADVDLAFERDALEVMVANPLRNGAAEVVPEFRHGLIGMRERAALVGGSVRADARGGWFRLHVRLPYAEAGSS
jgi:signal transduction histidine kinase